MFRNRLFWQMVLTAGFAAVFASAVIYFAVQLQLKAEIQQQAERNLEVQLPYAAAFARALLMRGDPTSNPQSFITSAWTGELDDVETRLSVIDKSGKVIVDSQYADVDTLDNHRNRPELLQAASAGSGRASRFSTTLNKDLLYFARRIDDGGMTLGYVRLATPLSIISAEVANLQRQLLLVVFFTLLVVFFASYVLSRRFYQPIARATAYAQEVSEGNYELRLPGLGQDEIAIFERTLNELARSTAERLESLLQSRNEVAAILSGLNEGVVALGRDEKIVHINHAARDLLGVESDGIGQKLWEVLRVPRLQELVDAAQHQDKTQQTEPQQTNKQQDQSLVIGDKTLEFSILMMRGESGSVDGTILVFQDVTERARLERMRVDFVANASHELKTPLAAIKGIVETVIDDPEMPREVFDRFILRVLSQTNRLHTILQDLMQLSRFDGYRQQRIAEDQVELAGQMNRVRASQVVMAEEKGVELLLDLPLGTSADVSPDLSREPVVVIGDPEAIEQLISNLVENAIKYSSAGSTVNLSLATEAEMAVIKVSDTGPGIPLEAQARVFERFYRVDPARSRELGGTGLGLSIVKNIAEAHGGLVELNSEIGRGSTFTVKIPLASRQPLISS